MHAPRKVGKSVQAGISIDRIKFWRYCGRAINMAQQRSAKRGIPCTITAHDIDTLLVDQEWRCAVSGIPLEAPDGIAKAFGPSVDRIVPSLGYVPGNIRIVCNMVNGAMNKWGEETLWQLVAAIQDRRLERRWEVL
jgi:hypothetical protein